MEQENKEKIKQQLRKKTKDELIDMLSEMICQNNNDNASLQFYGKSLRWDSDGMCSVCALRNKCNCRYRGRGGDPYSDVPGRPCNGFGIHEWGGSAYYDRWGCFREK